jgi:aspartate aminotransferase/aminotransferase
MILDKAVLLEESYHLEIGDPGFDTPEHIQEAAIAAIRGGNTHYTTHAGMPSLREAILEKVMKENNIGAKFEQIGVTPGGVFAVAAAMMAISEKGDEIMIPDPGWPNYHTQSVVIGLKPVYYHLSLDSNFQPDISGIESMISSRTRGIVINSPGNPTGAVFPRQVLQDLLEMCEKHDIYLISDEVYERILYEGEHFSPASLDPDGRVISIFATSKTYAMTGWRIGYYVAPQPVAKAMGRAIESYLSCASSISQVAALAALTGPQDCIAKMVRSYAERKDICVEALEKAGIGYATPQGAFYLMLGIADTGLGSYDFSTQLLDATGVAIAPGLTFGPKSDQIIRISYCANKEDVEEGIRRMCSFYQACTSG